jgi:hypothetical protein
MKISRKWIIVLAAIFVAIPALYSFAHACDRTQNGSGDKTMSAYGREGFKKSCDQNFRGHGGDKGRHKGWHEGKHQGRHSGGHKQEQSNNGETSTGNSDQNPTGTDTGTNQTAGSPADAVQYPDSASLLTQSWNSYNAKDYATAKAFANEAISRYSTQAAEQQASLSGFASAANAAQYWALNDVATAHFILGSSYQAQNDAANARTQFNTILSKYSYAQAYDPAQDLYWHVADAAQEALDNL